MRCAIIAVIALVSGFAQASQAVVRSIGLHQYVITDAGKEVWAKAYETCAKLGRAMHPLGVPPEEVGIDWGKQFKFECRLAYEIVPSARDTYAMWVPTEKIMPPPAIRTCPTCKFTVAPHPALEPDPNQVARTYCAKTHKTMVIAGGGFDTGDGLTLIFKCVAPQQGAQAQPTKVYLTILSSGTCSVDGHNIDCSDIPRYLHNLNIRHGCHILIRADQRARYAYVAAAVKSLQAASGLCQIGSIAVAQRQ